MSCSNGSSDFGDHQRPVIRKRSALREPIHLAQNYVGNIRRGPFMVLFDQLHNSRRAEELAFAVHGFRDSVRVEYKNISGLQRDGPFLVSHFLENSQWKSRQFNLPAASVFV